MVLSLTSSHAPAHIHPPLYTHLYITLFLSSPPPPSFHTYYDRAPFGPLSYIISRTLSHVPSLIYPLIYNPLSILTSTTTPSSKRQQSTLSYKLSHAPSYHHHHPHLHTTTEHPLVLSLLTESRASTSTSTSTGANSSSSNSTGAGARPTIAAGTGTKMFSTKAQEHMLSRGSASHLDKSYQVTPLHRR